MTEELQIDYTELQKTVERLLPDNFPVSFEELVGKLMRGETESLGGVL